METSLARQESVAPIVGGGLCGCWFGLWAWWIGGWFVVMGRRVWRMKESYEWSEQVVVKEVRAGC